MKNKLIGFFVCMLIFISTSPTTSVTTLQSDEEFQDLTIKATGTISHNDWPAFIRLSNM